MTVVEAIYKVLQDDAKLGGAGHLGQLLGHTATAPYGIFHMSPPAKPSFPLITYQEITAAGRMPRIEAINFTIWGGDAEAIHDLIYGLLHDAVLGATTGVQVVSLKWNWAGPSVLDLNYEVYTRVHRYLVRGVKI